MDLVKYLLPRRGEGKARGKERKMIACAENIVKQFQNWPAGQAGEFLVSDGELQVSVKMADSDRLGCLMERLEMKGTSGHPLNLDPLRVEKEVTYLGEPLKIVELEKYQGKALLRSFPPRRENGTVLFFELTIDRNEGLSLHRLSYDHALGTRSHTPVAVTRETLERLLADLVSWASTN